MDRGYVSEFTVFIDRYLKEHPEVVEDQQRGWDIFWNPQLDAKGPPAGTEEDQVPGEGQALH